MGIGVSILLIAAGAILRYAVTATTSGFSIQTVGLILMIAGAAGLVLSLFELALWRPRRRPGEIERGHTEAADVADPRQQARE